MYNLIHNFLYTKHFEFTKINDLVPYIENDNQLGGLTWNNDRYTNKWCSSLQLLEFNLFYPTAILNELNKVQSNISNLKGVMAYSIYLLDTIKLNHPNAHQIIKKFINSIFGLSNQIDSPILFYDNTYTTNNQIDISKHVVNQTRHILNMIKNEFSNHITYINTYKIYFIHFDEISNRFMEFSKSKFSNHSFNITKNIEGIFMPTNKYITKINNSINAQELK